MIAEWTDEYPTKILLKREARAMVDAILATLLEELDETAIRGIYFKGSAYRAWDTLLDYVPELSDVDIHLWLHEDHLHQPEPDVHNLDVALRIQAALERRYLEAIPSPLHLPRPQC